MQYQFGPGPLKADYDPMIQKLKNLVGIVEDTDIAQHAIANGQYVVWKGDLYVAKADISSGTTLSSSNLTAKTKGVGETITSLSSNITNKLDKTGFQVNSANASSFTFDAPRPIPGAYSFGLMFGATGNGQTDCYLYIIFVNTQANGNTVNIYPIKAHSTYTFSGSFNSSTDKLTINSSGTCYGGMCFLWRGQA